MTLGDFFLLVKENPSIVLFYFFSLPLSALLAWIFGRGEGHLSPWNYFYSMLVYLAAIPGIFAITLSVYLFLFERKSIFDTDVYMQILPILCMFLTLWLIRKNVSFDDIPGFDRISSLITMIIVIISMMWILEKTHIFVFTYMPFYQFVLIFIAFIIGVRYLLKRTFQA